MDYGNLIILNFGIKYHNHNGNYDTQYVCDNAFGGDTSIYDPIERAEKLCGFSVGRISNKDMADKFNSILYGVVDSNSTPDSTNQKFNNKTITNGTIIIGDPRVAVGVYEGNSYTIVNGSTPSRPESGTLTQAEKDYLIYR